MIVVLVFLRGFFSRFCFVGRYQINFQLLDEPVRAGYFHFGELALRMMLATASGELDKSIS